MPKLVSPRIAFALERAVSLAARSARTLLGVGVAARQSLVALGLNSLTSLVAGAVLGSITGTLQELPGLLVMIPAAIGLRDNVFSAVGARLSTAMRTGELDMDLRRRGVLRENVEASVALTLAMTVMLGLLAWMIGLGLGVESLTSPLSLVWVSVAGGLIASIVVLAVTLVLVRGAVTRGWDLDNVVAPMVAALGDVLTLPALWLAAQAADIDYAADFFGAASIVVAVVVFGRSLVSPAVTLRRVCRESWPVLTAAAVLSTLGGIALEHRIDTWQVLPALLILQPAFVSSAGALGSVLASRTASKLHLGEIPPSALPARESRTDALLVLGLGLPIYLLNGLGAHLVARFLGQASPGLTQMVAASLIGGLAAVVGAIVVAYYGTIAATSARLDPDTYGIPIVTSSVDFSGVVALVATVTALGII